MSRSVCLNLGRLVVGELRPLTLSQGSVNLNWLFRSSETHLGVPLVSRGRSLWTNARFIICARLSDQRSVKDLDKSAAASKGNICTFWENVRHCSTYHTTINSSNKTTRRSTVVFDHPHFCVDLGRKSTFSTRVPASSPPTGNLAEQDKDMSQFVVGHDTSKNLFYIKLHGQSPDQEEAMAVLDYSWIQPGLVDLYHTEVPSQFRGHGIAKVLAKAAFDHFCVQNIVIRPTCTYLQKFLREDPIPRYMDHLEKGFPL